MDFEALREEVWRANLRLVEAGLVLLTWGNASGVDRAAGVMAIKPSGIEYATLRPEHIVLLELASGRALAGQQFNPSSDTPTHLHLYRAFPALGGVVHTHSTCATSYAQALRELPCFGTTHADQFYGAVPLTRPLEPAEVAVDYELNTGKVIEACFRSRGLDPAAVPAVLVANHGPFSWGPTPGKAVENAIVLEAVAEMGLRTRALNPEAAAIPQWLLDKHFLRKHGPGAYYGQRL